MRLFLLLALPAMCSALLAQDDVVSVPVDGGWAATPGWNPPNDRAEKWDVEERDGTMSLTASGGGGTMVWCRHPNPPIDVSKMHYVTLRYRLTNIDPSLYSYLLYMNSAGDGGMLARNLIFGAGDLIHDGQWHNATTTFHPFGTIGTLALRFRALEGTQGCLDVAYLRLSASPPSAPLSETVRWSEDGPGITGEPIELKPLAKTSLPDLQTAIDLSDWFTAPDVTVDGVRFRVPQESPACPSTGISQREKLTVPVKQTGRALYLLLGAQFRYKMLSYRNWEPGDMTDRPEQCQVTLRYGDGGESEHVPYCVTKGNYGVWRGPNVYCVPLDESRKLDEFELRDGMMSGAFHLIAATVAQESSIPPIEDAPQVTPPGYPTEPTPPSLELGEGKLTARNSAGELEFAWSEEGFGLAGVRNVSNPASSLAAELAPLLGLKGPGGKLEPFRVAGPVEVDGPAAIIVLQSAEPPAEARLRVLVRDEDVALQLSLHNVSDGERSLDLVFPQVLTRTPEAADLWYFYPRMTAIWSDAAGHYDCAYGGEFPLQFIDVYDRRNGGGLSVGTRTTEFRQRYYRLDKQGNRARMRIEFRSNPPIPPGQTVEYPEVVLAPHAGDWRPVFAAYERWFRGWYEPRKPSPDWYRKVWNFRTYWTHTMRDGDPEVNLFDPRIGDFRTQHFIAKDREQFGHVDMAHLFDWRISKQYGRWGDYSHFEDIGGIDKFRRMVQDFQAAGIRVGLYLDCYLCSRKSIIGKEHGDDWALLRENGRVGTAYTNAEDPMVNMCVLHPGWQDYLAERCAWVAEQTGCDGIYLDEGICDLSQYWCWSDQHGHPVPGVNQAGLLELFRKVRQALPDRCALYTEHAPADIFIPYLDGAYWASLGKSDVRVSPGFLQMHRFAFPDLRLFLICNAGSMSDGIWAGLKYTLFNGVPLYTLAWGHEEEALALTRKISAILHEYSAAFLTPAPVPYLPTERNEVYCNQFAGGGRTVWTLWNGRYDTLTGPVLRVKHEPGTRYLDVWNGTAAEVRIEGGVAVISTTLGPRGVGVIARVAR